MNWIPPVLRILLLRVFPLTVLIVFLTPTSIQAQLADSPWPMFAHDPQHTGQSDYAGPQEGVLKWVFSFRTSVGTSPLTPTIGGDGTIYVYDSASI